MCHGPEVIVGLRKWPFKGFSGHPCFDGSHDVMTSKSFDRGPFALVVGCAGVPFDTVAGMKRPPSRGALDF